MNLKKCKCGLTAATEKELEWFVVDKNAKHGRANTCKECDNARRIAKRRDISIEEAKKFIQKKHSATYLRKCRCCGLEAFNAKDLSQFVTSKNSMQGVETQCKACQSLEHKARRYGVSMEFVEKVSMIKSCNICGAENNLVYDHCHVKEKGDKAFRGILCQGCNIGLGGFKDSISSLHNAIEYLKDFYTDDKNHTISSIK